MRDMNCARSRPSGAALVRVTAALIEEDGRVLLARRKKGDRFEGLWEFPGGKVEPGETPEGSLQRELLEELGVKVEVGERLSARPFRAAEAPMELLVFRARIVEGAIVCRDHEELRWVSPADLDDYALTDPDRRALPDLFRAGEGRSR